MSFQARRQNGSSSTAALTQAHLLRAAAQAPQPLAAVLGRKILEVASMSGQGLPRKSVRPCSCCGAFASEPATSDVHKLPRRAVRRQLARQHAAQQRTGTAAGANNISRWVVRDNCAACGHATKRLVQRPPGQQSQEQQGSKPQMRAKLAAAQPTQASQQPGLQPQQLSSGQQLTAAAQTGSPAAAWAQTELLNARAAAASELDTIDEQQQQQQQQQQLPEALKQGQPQAAAQGHERKRRREPVEAAGQEAAASAPVSTVDQDATPPCYALQDAEGGRREAALGQDESSSDPADSSAEDAAAASAEPASEASLSDATLQEDSATAAAGTTAAAAAASTGGDSPPCSEEGPDKRRRRLSWSEQLQDVRLIARARKPKLKRILSWRRMARSWKPAVLDLRQLDPSSGL
ncbi:hypothetical protein ABPG77_003823 [Micractinium sp. CCAP 211/92]